MMIIDSPKDFVPKFFDSTSETYEKVVRWATFGRDEYWKKIIINQIRNHDSILDLACGTGILTRKVASKFPKAKIIGIDITKNYLELAKKNSLKFENITYILQDAEELNIEQKFDCICSSYIPKYCNPKILVKNCIMHLNHGGSIILHDFTYPKNSLIQKIWNLHFILLNLLGPLIPEWEKAFLELPKLIKSSQWDSNYQKELEQNGFDVKRINLTFGTSIVLVATLRDKT